VTVTLATPTLNLNNITNYGLISIDLGPNNREEIWVEPFGSDTPVLAKVVNRRTKVTISLVVKGTSAADLQTRVEAVRNQFNGQVNTLTYSAGGVSKVMTTYDSQIDPVDFGTVETLYVAASQFLIPKWTFSVTRDSKFLSDTRPPVV
jgi:hypothetical protein